MLYLTEISIPIQSAIEAAMSVDPLVASDLDYCVKTWMADKPSLACRPWRATIAGAALRITGWRDEPASCSEKSVYLGAREVSLQAGETLALAGRFIALRRAKNRARDAAAGREDPEGAYATWLRERLIDLMPFASIEQTRIDSFSARRVLRKVGHGREHTRVASEVIPIVDATILLTVRDPVGVERWMRFGLGPQKAFGYGAFLPTIDPRGQE
jgi:hypothetical protein